MRHLETDAALRLFGVAADVRRENHVGQIGEPDIELRHGGRRFQREDIERRAPEVTARQRLAQRLDIHDLAARQVEQIAARAHAGKLGAANHGHGARRFGHVERHEIRFLEHAVEISHRAGEAKRQLPDDVVKQHPHAEGLGEQAHLLADVAVADQANGMSPHFVRAGQRFIPVAVVQRVALVAEAPGQGDDAAERELGHAAGGRVRRVEHRNPPPCRIADRDLIRAHREAADRQHPPGLLQMLFAHLGA